MAAGAVAAWRVPPDRHITWLLVCSQQGSSPGTVTIQTSTPPNYVVPYSASVLWLCLSLCCRSDLFFTLPRRLKAGLSGQVLFFNKSNSHTLRDTHGNVKIIVGRNGWKDTKYLDMAPVSGAQQLRLQPPKQLQEEVWAEWRAEHKQQLQKQQQQEEEAAAAAAKLAASTNGKNVPASAAAVASSSAAQQQQQHVMDPQLEGVLGQPSASCGISDGDWYLVQLPPLPADCYELNLVFSDEAGNAYDNNDR